MRLPVDVRYRILALGLTAALAGCGIIGGGGDGPSELAIAPAATGPAADYPMVLGEPFTVQGELYTPSDALNYDAVGYAVPDGEGGAAISVAHKTLPLPSYVELTSLDSGKTILARVERRGPMTGALVALSSGAQAQLGVAGGTSVRVRRVNPPEAERAELRAGRPAPDRLETPKSLVEVLRRKLPADGAARIGTPAPQQSAVQPRRELPPVAAVSPVAQRAASRPVPVAAPSQAMPAVRQVSTAYPLPPLGGAPNRAASVAPRTTSPVAVHQPAQPRQIATGDGFVIQAAAFSSKANADRAAGTLGGFVSPAGRFFRVRTGPYATRGQAEAALAKVRAAGYSDAKVFTAG